MIWRKLLWTIAVCSVMIYAFWLFDHWTGTIRMPGVENLFVGAAIVIALSMGTVGSDELVQCGHKKVRNMLFRYSLISLLLSMIVFGFEKLYKTSWDSLFLYSNSPFWLLVISQFPAALYLNRNHNKSISQQISNAL